MFSLKAFLGVDGSGYEAGLKKAEAQTEKFVSKVEKIQGAIGKAFSGNLSGLAGGFLGGAAAGGVGGMVVALLGKVQQGLDAAQEKAKDIKRGVAETGLDPQAYQRFAKTLDATGSSGEAGAKALEKVAEATEKIKNGDEGAEKLVKQFAALGVSLEDIKKKDYKQIFFDIADGMKDADLNAEKLTALKEVLGKGAIEMLPAFKLGFDSTASTRGTIGDEDLAKLNELNRIAKEAKGPWQEWGNQVSLTFAKVKVGAMQLVTGPLKWLMGGDSGQASPHFQGMEARLNKMKEEKAAHQAVAFAAKKTADERLKKEAELRKHFQEREESVGKQAAMEQFSLLTDQEKLRVLKAQSEILRHQKGFIDTELLNGDPSGQHAMELQQVELARATNARMQRDVRERLKALDDQLFSSAALNVSAHSKLGAQTDNPFARPELRQLITALIELNRNLTNTNRPLPQFSEYS